MCANLSVRRDSESASEPTHLVVARAALHVGTATVLLDEGGAVGAGASDEELKAVRLLLFVRQLNIPAL